MNLKFEEQWAELLALFFLFVGFILVVMLRKPAYIYLVVFLAGLLAGRTYFLKKMKEPLLPFVLMIIGFLVGVLVGVFWASRLISIILFMVSFILSYYLHQKYILGRFKSKNFIK